MKTHVKPLTAQDYKSVKDIYDSEFKLMGKKTMNYPWKNRIPDLSLGIFNNEGDLLGFTLVVRYSNFDVNYLSRIAIHSSFQNLGLGNKLLKAVLQKSYLKKQALYLTPLNRTTPLIKFYCNLGFYGTGNGQMTFHFYNTRRQGLFNRHYVPAVVPKQLQYSSIKEYPSLKFKCMPMSYYGMSMELTSHS
jgi:GNAT superfamily N-acetyltransferase